jgi:hypothetical protein
MLAIRTRILCEIVAVTKGKPVEVNGIAHIFLTASNFEHSRAFCRKLLPFLGLKPVIPTASGSSLIICRERDRSAI